jgi:uncharacterized protein YcbK (DUF882 family)
MISRRNFLRAFLTASIVYPVAANKAFAARKTERALHLHNIHTDEELSVRYYRDGIYDFEAIEKINYLLRCHYTDEVKPIDIGVLDLLCDVKDNIVTGDRRIEIISGYRSPAYNEYLMSIGRHVAKKSYHLKGKAIDFSIPGIRKRKLCKTAKSFVSGGVGKYADFIHIDTGPVRYW